MRDFGLAIASIFLMFVFMTIIFLGGVIVTENLAKADEISSILTPTGGGTCTPKGCIIRK